MWYILRSGDQYYTGRAMERWLSFHKEEAYPYGSRALAEKMAHVFNRQHMLHGERQFVIEEIPPA